MTAPEKLSLRDRIAQHLAAHEGRPGDWIGFRDQADVLLAGSHYTSAAPVVPAAPAQSRPHPLIGYAVGHILDDSDGALVEWFEDERGRVPAHPTPAAARKVCDDEGGDPATWQVLELRAVPDGSAG